MEITVLSSGEAMTQSEINLVQDSFRGVKAKRTAAAAVFYAGLFSYDSTLRALCEQDETLRTARFIETLEDLVAQLNDSQNTSPHLIAFARRYAGCLQNNYHYFYFGAALFSMLEQTLGRKFNAATYAAWFKFHQLTVQQLKQLMAQVEFVA